MGPLEAFLTKYGDKGYLVLKAIEEASSQYWRGPRPGDFSFKQIKESLARRGVSYNPSPLLRILEKELGIIETTYKSTQQHWWRIVDREALQEALAHYEGEKNSAVDPKIKLLKIQFHSLEPYRILEVLRKLSLRKKLNERERRIVRQIAFEDLPKIVEFLERAEDYEEDLYNEIYLAESILDLAEKVVRRMSHAPAPTAREKLEYSSFRGYREPL